MKTLIFVILMALNIFAQVNPKDMFPLQVGNKWEWDYAFDPNQIIEIVNDSIAGSQHYYITGNSAHLNYYVDSLNYMYEYYHIIDTIMTRRKYKLDGQLNDIWIESYDYNNGRISQLWVDRVEEVFYSNLFGRNRLVMKIRNYKIADSLPVIDEHSWPVTNNYLAEGIGKFYELNEESGPYASLLGCIINGDTLGKFTDVKEKINNPPEEFSLYQNFPNPFNPETNILYEISSASTVRITIYSITGQIIKQYAEGIIYKGKYSRVFNAGGLPSGIYFCRVEICPLSKGYNVLSKTIKMLFLK